MRTRKGSVLPGPLFGVIGSGFEEEEVTDVRRPEGVHRLPFGAPLRAPLVDATLERLRPGSQVAPVKAAANDLVDTSVTEFHHGETINRVVA